MTGNQHRTRRYDRRLLRVFYLSGPSALKSCPASRCYYDRKRVEGKTHIQAMLALAAAASMSSGPCSATSPPTSEFPGSKSPGTGRSSADPASRAPWNRDMGR